jgi:hypothetical protein
MFEDGAARPVALPAINAVPQSPQKRWLGGFSAPHFGQRFVSAAPQSPQNLFAAGFSLPHFEQRIYSSTLFATILSQKIEVVSKGWMSQLPAWQHCTRLICAERLAIGMRRLSRRATATITQS